MLLGTSVFPSSVKLTCAPVAGAPHEARRLRLDCSRAARELEWHGVWTPEECFRRTAAWYRDFYRGNGIGTAADLRAYVAEAEKQGLTWTK